MGDYYIMDDPFCSQVEMLATIRATSGGNEFCVYIVEDVAQQAEED